MARAPLRDTDPAQVGRYRLTARLGAGGMGVVYLGTARDGSLVAVKVLRPELTDDPEFRDRFGREVTNLTRVKGVCTVRVIEADTDSARPFMVTEYVSGPSLSEYVARYGPPGPDMMYGLATGLAEALTAIHAAGVVHRDLKRGQPPDGDGRRTGPGGRHRRLGPRAGDRPLPELRPPHREPAAEHGRRCRRARHLPRS